MPHSYRLTGMGEVRPQAVVGTQSEFVEAREICLEEIRLIRHEIEACAIPLPPRPLQDAPPGPPVIRDGGGEARPTAELPAGPHADRADWRFPLPEWLVARLWRNRLQPLLQETLASAVEGTIVVHGSGHPVDAFVQLLRAAGRDAVGWFRNPSSPGAIAAKVEDMAVPIGAIVLISRDGAPIEIAALEDRETSAPVLLASLGNGSIAVQRIALKSLPEDLPRISIVTVSYNQVQYLEACIQSVISENYPNLEYIIVDGGSTDGSVELIERYRSVFAHVIIEPDNGQSEALNKGFARATGELMNWLCSDDMLMPGALRSVGRAFRAHNADLVVGACLRIGETLEERHFLHRSVLPLGKTQFLDPLDILKFMRSWQLGRYFFQPEVFFSRRIWDAAGGYLKPHLYYAMDYDMWLRMAFAGATVRAIAPGVGCSRVHQHQKTRDDRVYLHQMVVLMKEYLAIFQGLINAKNLSASRDSIGG